MPFPAHQVPRALLQGACPVPAPRVTRHPTRGSISSLVASALADPRGSRIIIYFHFLEVLVLPLELRMLVLGEEECFFTDLVVRAFMVWGR